MASTAADPKSSMEESADALAGVEGALTGAKRKAAAAPAGPSKKAPGGRSRSGSVGQLAEVAGSLLSDSKGAKAPVVPSALAAAAAAAGATTLAAAAASAASVPDPMATAAANEAAAARSAPTGFRKKAGAKPPPSAASGYATARPVPEEARTNAKKAQVTYNPDVPMTKEQLTAWRREMRRVRNRESAAASRRKVRDRIEELEEEVAVWKRRYREVLARLNKTMDGEGGGAGETTL